MTWGRNPVRTTEWVLEELYQTGRQWMSESARRKRYAPITSPVMEPRPDAADGVPPDDHDTAEIDTELRARFETLFTEFVNRLEGH
jgi:hypothetical protein